MCPQHTVLRAPRGHWFPNDTKRTLVSKWYQEDTGFQMKYKTIPPAFKKALLPVIDCQLVICDYWAAVEYM